MQPFEQLELEWSKFNDLDQAGMVACSSGTAALHLALEAMQPPSGSRVIVPDFTMIACARAVTMAGLEPVFVDCQREDLLIDCDLVPLSETSPVEATMAVHIYGRQCNMERLAYQSSITGRKLIEDLAEAHGVKPHPQTDAACWSFYKNKIVAGEEGGAVWFRDPSYAKRARKLRSLGFTDAHNFTHIPRGHNYRMSNAHAVLVLQSLRMYDWNLRARREMESRWDVVCPTEWRMPPRDAPWVYDLRIPGMRFDTQDRIVRAVRATGVVARHGFKPMSLQQEYGSGSLPPIGASGQRWNSLRASCEVIYLPLAPSIPTVLVEQVMGIVKQEHERAQQETR